jgi:hypothetical protein
MQEARLISEYAELLARELSFDRSLSRGVRQEVEDHLREAVAADPSDQGGPDAERRAIANFGDLHVIVSEFATLSLAKQATRAGVITVLMIAAVFVAMKTRVAWYAATQWSIRDDWTAISRTIGIIDYYTSLSSVFIGIAACAYICSRRTPIAFCPEYHSHLRRWILICVAAMGALIASVISDGALTVLRLLGGNLSAASLIPIVSMAIEIVCTGIVVFWIRSVLRRTATVAALMGT